MSTLTHAGSNLNAASVASTPGSARVDLVLVAQMVEYGAKVLDVGCGDGELLRLLSESRGVDGRQGGHGHARGDGRQAASVTRPNVML